MDNAEETIITNSSDETQNVAENLAKNLEDTKFLALFGNLGSGKTTFVQGFAKGLGIRQRIISPTFIIVREHKIGIKNEELPASPKLKRGERIKNFYHIDLYRVQTPHDIEGLGLKEIFNDQNNIVAVEWAEKIKNILPEERIELYFENLEENRRRVTIKRYG